MPDRKGGHLTLQDRIAIEDGLAAGEPVNAIARRLGVSWTAISNEIRRHRTRESRHFRVIEKNLCAHRGACELQGLCRLDCDGYCCSCSKGCACNLICDDFEPVGECPKCERAPWVCNGCRSVLTVSCGWPNWFYDAKDAQREADWSLVTTRQGVSCTPDELRAMVEVVRPLMRQGQSLQHIWQTHGPEFPVGYRTFYRYINLGLLDIINLDLPKKVKYKPRRKRPKKGEVPFRPNLEGRTYQDFQALPSQQQLSCVEMDCVEPGRGGEKVILTLLFRRLCFQLMILMPAHTQGCVKLALDQVEMACGKEAFARLFAVVLTDRGHEFMDFGSLEESIDGGKRCKVYYCDPLQSGQKGRCEKNHVELRKVLPKGTRFDDLDNADMAVVCSHVNSYGRPVLGGACPFDLARGVLPKSLLDELGLEQVPRDEVVMRPSLLMEAGRR